MPLLDLIYPARLDGVSRTVPIISKLLLIVCLVFYFLRNHKKWWFKNSIGKIITIFILIHLTYLVISSDSYSVDLYKFSKTAIWYCGYFFFLDLGYRRNVSKETINRFFIIGAILLFSLVVYGVTNEVFFRSNRDYAASNQAYYLAFLLPFLFMDKKVPFRLVLFAIISIGVAISMKRGTMVMYAVMVVYLLFFSNLKQLAGNRFSKFFRIFIILVIVLVLFQFVFANFDDYIQKFSDITEADEDNVYKVGSGRGALYLLPLERWVNSNVFHLIFGYGYNATPDFYPTTGVISGNKYAHSDFVMLIHDYGVVGLSILISLFYRLFFVARKSVFMRNRIPLFLIFLALLIKSLVSGFILYEYSIYIFAILGLILGRMRREKLELKLYNEGKVNG